MEKLNKTNAYIEFNQGLDARLLTEERIKLLQKMKIRMLHFAWDDPNDTVAPKKLQILGKHEGFHKGNTVVYILINYNSTEEQDLERIYKVREMGLSPYIMIYDKPNADKRKKRMARWVNNRWVFASCEKWEEYK